jgi:hypothetical protein
MNNPVVPFQKNVSRVGDGTGFMPIRGLRDGTVVVVPWYQALVLEGRVYSCAFGATDQGATDPGTFGAGGVDLTEFDFLMGIPASKAVIPLYFHAIFEAIGTVAALDVLMVMGTAGVAGANSVANTPRNALLGGDASSCAVATVADAAGTAITVQGTVYRAGGTYLTAAAGDLPRTDFEWSALYDVAPVIPGAGATPAAGTPLAANAQLAAFASAQAATGFMTVKFAELPAAAVA